MKILGFVLIIVSSAICGLCYVNRKNERLEDLRSLSLMLELMHGELSAKLSPLPELAETVSAKVSGKAAVFLKVLCLNLNFLGDKNFSALWNESLDASAPELSDKERGALEALGAVLGKYELSMQTAALDECMCLLRESCGKESLELPQLKRLSLGVSVSAGALLAILLV